jgi:hypothetical protein
MAVGRVVASEAGAGLVHVDAVHAQLADGLFGQPGVMAAPEFRAQAHRGAGFAGEGVIHLGMDLAVRAFDGKTRCAFVGPARGGHAPEALVHVHQGAQIPAVRLAEGALKGIGAFPWREVFREAGVIGAAMPPVPEHAHGQPQFLRRTAAGSSTWSDGHDSRPTIRSRAPSRAPGRAPGGFRRPRLGWWPRRGSTRPPSANPWTHSGPPGRAAPSRPQPPGCSGKCASSKPMFSWRLHNKRNPSERGDVVAGDVRPAGPGIEGHALEREQTGIGYTRRVPRRLPPARTRRGSAVSGPSTGDGEAFIRLPHQAGDTRKPDSGQRASRWTLERGSVAQRLLFVQRMTTSTRSSRGRVGKLLPVRRSPGLRPPAGSQRKLSRPRREKLRPAVRHTLDLPQRGQVVSRPTS